VSSPFFKADRIKTPTLFRLDGPPPEGADTVRHGV